MGQKNGIRHAFILSGTKKGADILQYRPSGASGEIRFRFLHAVFDLSRNDRADGIRHAFSFCRGQKKEPIFFNIDRKDSLMLTASKTASAVAAERRNEMKERRRRTEHSGVRMPRGWLPKADWG